MATDKSLSTYHNTSIVLATKHAKATAVAPSFARILDATVEEHHIDTDQLGTFSGEIDRETSALDCAKRKCEWGAQQNQHAEFLLASEGSFGPHPQLVFCPADHEILYFIDRRHEFHLAVTHLSQQTNYLMKMIDTEYQLDEFAAKAQFPSHALIVRPNQWDDKSIIFKGLTCQDSMRQALRESIKHSADNKAWVETDMRAHLNPSRMAVISECAEKLAKRLNTHCPKCHTPGWGQVNVKTGLPCSWCGFETELVQYAVYGCTKCEHQEFLARTDKLHEADPSHCGRCNP